ncbi:phytoene/squalene synthase family protein [Gracilinema caldarium]|uniref:phytoene/squalene synthase family protein n=1 Tax=Gracilinema caldarium TaxID=215591 RepID=UPI0026F32DF5|nr:phytoene/squalene synthase family protein [Gracilinema caldarium]
MQVTQDTIGLSDLKAYQKATFQHGSKTYFNASRFFPPQLRERVYTLYAFVRRADDFVDAQPQDAAGFYRFRACAEQALGINLRQSAQALSLERASQGFQKPAPDEPAPEEPTPEDRAVIDAFVALGRTVGFDPAWTVAFLDAMEADLTKQNYDTLNECLTYMYGSAEVIGLFMSRCMELPEAALEPARLLGRAMQYINFIRDVSEDRTLGRRYLPLEGESLEVTEPLWAQKNPERFAAWLRYHLSRYREWQQGAVLGYRFIPYRYRIPIMTAADMYWWTAEVIEKQPLVVFQRKVKPSKKRIFVQFFLNILKGLVV